MDDLFDEDETDDFGPAARAILVWIHQQPDDTVLGDIPALLTEDLDLTPEQAVAGLDELYRLGYIELIVETVQ